MFSSSHHKNQEDQDLILGIKRKDPQAYSRFIDKYQKLVFTIVQSVVKDYQQSEEVSQDVFMKVFDGLSNYRYQSRLSTWIYTIAYRQALNAIRRQPRLVTVDNFELMFTNLRSDHNEMKPSDTEWEPAQLSRAVKQLADNEKLMLTLFYYEAQSIEEIAAIMEMEKNTVKVRLFRIRKKLKDSLKIIHKHEG